MFASKLAAALTLAGALVAAGCAGSNTEGTPDTTATSVTRVTEAEVQPPPPRSPPQPRPSSAAAIRLVRSYYSAIDRKVFGGAWSLLSPTLRSDLGGYSKWYAGYAYTESNVIEAIDGVPTGPNTVSVSVRLTAQDKDACGDLVTQEFAGKWNVAGSGSDWQATAINLRKTAGDSPIRDVRLCGPVQNPSSPGQICYPPIILPAVDYPEQVIGNTVIPAIHIPAKTLSAYCLETDPNFQPSVTSVWDGDYTALDPAFSPNLSTSYWDSFPAASLPDPTAAGFGELNAAGFPKNQYVRPYVRRDGTAVGGYWRNSPTDGLPTCKVITC